MPLASRDGDLRERLAAAIDAAPLDRAARGGVTRERVADDVGRAEDVLRVVLRQQRGRAAAAERLEVDDARVRGARGIVDEVLVHADGARVAAKSLTRDRELRQLPALETALERRHERDPDDAERARDDERQRDAEPGPDAPERVHEPPAQSLRAA